MTKYPIAAAVRSNMSNATWSSGNCPTSGRQRALGIVGSTSTATFANNMLLGIEATTAGQ